MGVKGSGKGMLSPSTEYTISYSVFIYYFSQAEVHLGDLWHGFIERCPAGSYVQSFDREDQHRHLSALVEGGSSAQGEPARFCDGRQRQETMAGGVCLSLLKMSVVVQEQGSLRAATGGEMLATIGGSRIQDLLGVSSVGKTQGKVKQWAAIDFNGLLSI